jgi:hypothetical protein
MRKIAFPIMRAPEYCGGNECAIYLCEPIEHAHASLGVAPMQCWVMGTDLVKGVPRKWNVPIEVFQEAVRNAVTFAEVDNMRAPAVILGPKNLPLVYK